MTADLGKLIDQTVSGWPTEPDDLAKQAAEIRPPPTSQLRGLAAWLPEKMIEFGVDRSIQQGAVDDLAKQWAAIEPYDWDSGRLEPELPGQPDKERALCDALSCTAENLIDAVTDLVYIRGGKLSAKEQADLDELNVDSIVDFRKAFEVILPLLTREARKL